MTTPPDIQERIGHELKGAAPDQGWKSLTLHVRRVEGYAEAELICDGNARESTVAVSPSLMRLTRILRETMATPDHGTWFSAIFKIVRPDNFTMKFNYDDEPQWDAQIEASVMEAAYEADYERFPRRPSELPDWHPSKR